MLERGVKTPGLSQKAKAQSRRRINVVALLVLADHASFTFSSGKAGLFSAILSKQGP
jgi:hypothetical protein